MGHLYSLGKRVSLKVKDYRIQKNIRDFIRKNEGRQVPAREVTFLPEILIPCYNHGRFLRTALSSVPKDMPVTIINDASRDDTGEYIRRLTDDYRFTVITNKKNLFQTGSLNVAVERSANNLFIVLNADDVLFRYWPSLMLDLFRRYPKIRLAGGNSLPFVDDHVLNMNAWVPESLGYLPEPRIMHPEDALHYSHLNAINMTMSGCTFLRSCWEAVGGFLDFRNRVCSFDDRDFQMRASALFDIAILDEPSAFYRVTSSQQLGQY